MFCCSIDATDEPVNDDPYMGRLVNHSKHGNARVMTVGVSNKPHVCLFATQNIKPGEQILYDYGVHVPFVDMVIIFSFHLEK